MYRKTQKNFLPIAGKLFGLNILSYAIFIAGTPIVTRLYEPEQFGTFSLLIFIGSLISLFCTWRLEVALPLVKDDFESLILIKIIFLIQLSFLSFCCLAVFIFYLHARVFLPADLIGNWFLAIPFFGALLAGSSVVQMLLLRNQRYNTIGCMLLIQNASFICAAISIALTDYTINGLIIGKAIGLSCAITLGVGAIVASRSEFANSTNFKHFIKSVRTVLVKYRDFPKFNLPLSVLGIL